MVDNRVKRNYNSPTQVAWYEYDIGEWIGGIAFGEDIISLDDGSFISIPEYLDEIESDYPYIHFPIIPLEWVNLSDECIDGLEYNYKTGEAK